MKNILLLLFFGLSTTLCAQKKEANQLYEQLGYKASVSFLEQQDKLSIEDKIKIANAYRLNHDVIGAEQWYQKVIAESNDPIYLLYYAQALHSNQKYEEAKEYYQQFNNQTGGSDRRGERLIAAIDGIKDFKENASIITNERAINSATLDFSPAFYNDGIVFVSARNDKAKKNKTNSIDNWTNEGFMNLFHTTRNKEGILSSPVPFSTNLASEYHEGPLTFSKDNQQVFFCRSHQEKGKKILDDKRIVNLNIYSAQKKGEDWGDIKELSFNTLEYDEVHPSLTVGGDQLYFASNRSDGYGGMDIYVVTKSGDSWSSPINLGAEVNTAGNEIFPFIHEDGTLYFASDGWGGLGGLDIFSTSQSERNQWAVPINIGTPFNSSKDDFGFILNTTGTEGYLSSAREGGLGQDDIYSFKTKDKDQLGRQIIAKVCAYDAISNEAIEGVTISLSQEAISKDQELDGFTMEFVSTGNGDEYLLKMINKNGLPNTKELMDLITDQEGAAFPNLMPNEPYFLIAQKKGYAPVEVSFEATLNENNEIEYCFAMEQMDCLTLKGKIINHKYERTIPKAELELVNLCDGETNTISSDRNGNYLFDCIPCGCEFVLRVRKTAFETIEESISTLESDCPTQEKIIKNMLMVNGEEQSSTNKGRNRSKSESYSIERERNTYPSKEHNTVEQEGGFIQDISNLEVGKIIELKNIYYDFNKHYIRNGASNTLDYLVQVMQNHPSLIIELSSHTDTRGTANYNMLLSRLRAKSAMDYLIEKGIAPERLSSQGYGETSLKNHCSDGVYCSEGEHQINRRTEVKIVAYEESSNVEVSTNR